MDSTMYILKLQEQHQVKTKPQLRDHLKVEGTKKP